VTDTYSTYDAKAKLSVILRKVEQGRVVHISRNGRLIAEVRPVSRATPRLAERIAELTERGIVVPPRDPDATIGPVMNRPGALRRFLEERNR
jgi:prevent-host-death family protein